MNPFRNPFLWAVAVAVGLAAVLGVADVASTPTPPKGKCILTKRIILPDICANSCPAGTLDVCTVSTRPYAIIFTQAATCADAVIC